MRRSRPAPPLPVPGAPPAVDGEPPAAETGRKLGYLLDRLRRNASLVAGGLILAFFVLVALAALLHYGTRVGDLTGSYAIAAMDSPPGPSLAHPFGYMRGNGVEILPALFQATPWDLALVGGPIVAALLVGLTVGGLSALGGGALDGALLFVTDLLVSVPPWILVLVFFLALQPLVPPTAGLLLFGGISAAVLWPYYARPIRTRAKAVVVEPYVEAARATGARSGWILTRHVIPNSLFPAFAQVPVDIFNLFFVLTAFPFLGCFGGGAAFGYVTPLPRTVFPEWGYLLAAGTCYGFSVLPALNHWWMYVFPLGAILLFSLGVTFLCDGLLRWFDATPAT